MTSHEEDNKSIDKDKIKDDKLIELMKKSYEYPAYDDPEFQRKIYEKREFYYHRYPMREELKEYKDIKEYRDKICARKFELQEHQAMLMNFISPNTPYRGILITHGTGTGKCMIGSDLVYINGNLKKFEEVWNQYKVKKVVKDKNGGEWCRPKEELIVNSFNNQTGKIIQQKVNYLYRERINNKIKEITLDNGLKINVTQDHKLLTINEWSNEFKVGDYICIPKKIYNCIGKNKYDIIDELVILMAWQIAEGYENIDREYLLITSKNLKILELLKNYIIKIGKYYNLEINNPRIIKIKNGISYLQLYSKDYINFLEKCGYQWGKFSKDKQFPDFIMNLSKEKLRQFIKHYFDAECHIYREKNIIEILSTSKILIYQLFYILKIFEIDSKIKIRQRGKRKYFELVISNTFLKLFEKDNRLGFQKEVNYVKIKSIREYVYNGYVYDLEIKNLHNFVVEGIISHNTCAAITIAEQFKPMIQKYNTKIYVLVSGPLIKEHWKKELLTCTKETYLKDYDKTIYMSEVEKQKAQKNAINVVMQYYRFMSYRSFYKKVLGEKISEKIKTKDDKIKVTYRKTKEGEFERDIAIDRIYNLNNSVIIVDEAHNLTGNAYGEALSKIIKNSYNLRVILLTATPMKNLADDIIELINFIRPPDSPIERDKIFTSHKNHLMDLKPGGLEYFKEMTRGYISYLRGMDPLTFAKRVDKGTVPKGLLFTNVIQCKMLPFQRKIYDQVVRIKEDVETIDTLDRRSEAVANFAFPGLSLDKYELTGYYGREGLNIVKNQLRTHFDVINKKIATEILNTDEEGDYMYLTEDGRNITGKILKFQNIRHFSIKFYKALKKISRLVWGKKGTGTVFIYSNLVKVGIELFQETLLQNGYLEYNDNPSNYKIKQDTICYFCGKTYRDHQQQNINLTNDIKKQFNISESSTEYKLKTDDLPEHEFNPATFISITGKSTEEAAEFIPEDKQRILNNVFNHIDNKEGKYIKFVLGSKIMSEAITLKNVSEVHILDVYFNLGKVDQVIGRAIRHCSHYQMITDQNKFPVVNVYKYAVTLENSLSSEEELYRKAELKYILIKKIERAMKEVAIDCPLNRHGNIFPEEITKFKNCVEPGKQVKKGQVICPQLCDYMNCNFKCDDKVLNKLYFNEERNTYNKIPKEKLDYSTFTHELAKSEIESVKTKIKDMYRIRYVYTLPEIVQYIRNSYTGEKKELFDEFFVFKALDDLIPITENDFNNFKDTIFDKYNRPGYLIYINKYYIFQPFDQNENVPMYYRTLYDKPLQSQLTLYNYLKNTPKFKNIIEEKLPQKDKILTETLYPVYDFESAMEYYDKREEFKYVGIIDKESSRRKIKSTNELQDVFKIRERRSKILEKKRGTGIASFKGSVCSVASSKEKLQKIAKDLNISIKDNESREEICEKIKNRLLFLEKYSTNKKKNKFTYLMIPVNHPILPFPLNLEDRKDYIIKQINDKIKFQIYVTIKEIKKKIHKETVILYRIEINDDPKLNEFEDFLKSLGFKQEKGNWFLMIE